MPTVELRFTALPAHVRTARLVAAAVARRSGVPEGVLDEVRLAVGEACARAVDLHRRHCPDQPVTVMLSDDDRVFRVAVVDQATHTDEKPVDTLAALEQADLSDETVPSGVELAVISGLVDDMSVETGAEGGVVVRMSWPATG